MATQTVARIKPLEDLNSRNRGLLLEAPLSARSGSPTIVVYADRRDVPVRENVIQAACPMPGKRC